MVVDFANYNLIAHVCVLFKIFFMAAMSSVAMCFQLKALATVAQCSGS